jgi:hypothetical protein
VLLTAYTTWNNRWNVKLGCKFNCTIKYRIPNGWVIPFVCRAGALYTFKNAFPVVVHALDSLQDDDDDKAGMHLAAILRFEFIIALVVTEYILSNTVALTI